MDNQAFGFQAENVGFPVGKHGETYHVGALKNTLPQRWLLPGSYDRADSVKVIAKFMNAAKEVWSDVSEELFTLGTRPHQYHALVGMYKGTEMGICATGIGAPAAEIAVVELTYGGARNFIRVGTSGCIDEQIKSGDLVVINESRGNVGTVMEYLGRDRMFDYIPCNAEVVSALEKACLSQGLSRITGEHERGTGFKTGRGYCADSFYHGQGRAVHCPLTLEMENLIPQLLQERVLTIEMETPGIAAVVTAYRERGEKPVSEVKVGSLVTPVANRITNDWTEDQRFQMQAVLVASEALHQLEKSP